MPRIKKLLTAHNFPKLYFWSEIRQDEFFVIHRYTQHERDWIYTDIHVRKVKELESGGRPTSLDNPVRLASTQGNCGFAINGLDLVTKERQIDESPF